MALRTFYENGYGLIRGVDERVAVVISDAFRGLREWEGFMPSNRYNRVVLDTVSRRRWLKYQAAYLSLTISR